MDQMITAEAIRGIETMISRYEHKEAVSFPQVIIRTTEHEIYTSLQHSMQSILNSKVKKKKPVIIEDIYCEL